MRLRQLVIVLLLVSGLLGCGSEKDRNRNRDRDRPQSAPKEPAEKGK